MLDKLEILFKCDNIKTLTNQILENFKYRANKSRIRWADYFKSGFDFNIIKNSRIILFHNANIIIEKVDTNIIKMTIINKIK